MKDWDNQEDIEDTLLGEISKACGGCMRDPLQSEKHCKYCDGRTSGRCQKVMPVFQPDYPPECNFCVNKEDIIFSDYHHRYIVKCSHHILTTDYSSEEALKHWKNGECPYWNGDSGINK